MRDPTTNAPASSFLKHRPWGPFLAEVDSKLTERVALHCLGGFVLQAIYDIPRITGDLDYLEVIPKESARVLDEIAGPTSMLARKYKLHFHPVGVIDLPEDYESRLQNPDFGLIHLQLLIPEPYDLLLSKLPRNSPKDREDAKFLIRKCGLKFSLLERRFDNEMKPWIAHANRHQLTLNLWREFF